MSLACAKPLALHAASSPLLTLHPGLGSLVRFTGNVDTPDPAGTAEGYVDAQFHVAHAACRQRGSPGLMFSRAPTWTSQPAARRSRRLPARRYSLPRALRFHAKLQLAKRAASTRAHLVGFTRNVRRARIRCCASNLSETRGLEATRESSVTLARPQPMKRSTLTENSKPPPPLPAESRVNLVRFTWTGTTGSPSFASETFHEEPAMPRTREGREPDRPRMRGRTSGQSSKGDGAAQSTSPYTMVDNSTNYLPTCTVDSLSCPQRRPPESVGEPTRYGPT